MKKMLMGIVTIAVLLFNCQNGKAVTANQGEGQVVEILIGEASFEYVGKAKTPVPEVTFGKKFDIVVTWPKGTGGIQSLAFSDFTVVGLKFEDAALPPKEGSPPMWRRIGPATLEADAGGGYELNDGEVRFLKPGDGSPSQGTFILIGPEEMDDLLGRPGTAEEARGTVLIFFNVELQDQDGKRIFFFDPPWAGKKG